VFHHTSRKTSWRDVEAFETRESQELQGLGQRLWSCNISSRSHLEQNFKRLGLVSISETWVSGLVSVSTQKVSCTSLHFSSFHFCRFKHTLTTWAENWQTSSLGSIHTTGNYVFKPLFFSIYQPIQDRYTNRQTDAETDVRRARSVMQPIRTVA